MKHSLNAPELQHLPPEDRVRMVAWAQEKLIAREQRRWFRTAAGIVSLLLLALILDFYLKNSAYPWLAMLAPMLIGTLFVLFFGLKSRVMEPIRDRFNVQYHNRLLPTCWKCGHVLIDAADDLTHCPECGHPDIRGFADKATLRRDRLGW